MSGVAADLGVVVGRLLVADLRDLVDGELQAELGVLQAAHDRLVVAIADRLGVWDTRRVWAADGSLSAAHAWARVSRQSVASTTLGGCVALDAWLNAVDGAIVVDELERLERELFLADRRDGVQRGWSQRMAAALVAMATRSAMAPSDGRRPQPLFTVLVGDQTLSRLCELANGTVITPAQLLAHVDTALLETVLFDGPSTVVSVSNRRGFMGAVRRAIQVRDRRCRHPSGCDVPASRCDVDHIVPWSRNGPTSQFNGRLECTTQNRHRDEHDHHATPRPELVRPIDRLDEMRARLRWRCLRDPDPDPDPDELV